MTVVVEQNQTATPRFGEIQIDGQVKRIYQYGTFDLWMQEYFTDQEIAAMQPSARDEDSDGDGFTNHHEQILNTDPSRWESKFAAQWKFEEGKRWIEAFPYTEAISLVLESNTDLSNWMPLDGITSEVMVESESGDGSMRFFIDDESGAFYRIEVDSVLLQ